MARPIKKGLDYFSLDVDVFSDRKIRILYAHFGSDGFTLYIYLLCQIFREGYYMTVDDDFNCLAASDLNISAEKIGLMMNFLLERSLFDNTLFGSDKVLTSAGIQRRYQQAVSKRAAKNSVTVNERLWLLDHDETEAYIRVCPDDNNSAKNINYSEKNASYSEKNHTKESKGKKSKEKESKVYRYRIPCKNGVFNIDNQLYDQLTHTYPNIQIDDSVKKLCQYLNANPDKQRVKSAAKAYLELWLGEDNRKAPLRPKAYTPTYDIAEYESYNVIDEFIENERAENY